jgi:thioredoxin-related protein
MASKRRHQVMTMNKGMILRNLIFVIFLFVMHGMYAQSVNWLSWEEVDEKMEDNPKKILVELFKEPCSWCYTLEENILNAQKNAQYINRFFYPVRFDVNSKESIRINEKVYKSTLSGDHELVRALTNGNTSLPMLVFVDESFKVIQILPGRQDPRKFHHILEYFGENHYNNVPWSRFMSRRTSTNGAPQNHGHFTNDK